jgi:hypothetical protein
VAGVIIGADQFLQILAYPSMKDPVLLHDYLAELEAQPPAPAATQQGLRI